MCSRTPLASIASLPWVLKFANKYYEKHAIEGDHLSESRSVTVIILREDELN